MLVVYVISVLMHVPGLLQIYKITLSDQVILHNYKYFSSFYFFIHLIKLMCEVFGDTLTTLQMNYE